MGFAPARCWSVALALTVTAIVDCPVAMTDDVDVVMALAFRCVRL
jgi:hypothetical protein